MGSGYGFTTYWRVSTGQLSGTTAPLSTAYTGAQSASILLPEYKYSRVLVNMVLLNWQVLIVLFYQQILMHRVAQDLSSVVFTCL